MFCMDNLCHCQAGKKEIAFEHQLVRKPCFAVFKMVTINCYLFPHPNHFVVPSPLTFFHKKCERDFVPVMHMQNVPLLQPTASLSFSFNLHPPKTVNLAEKTSPPTPPPHLQMCELCKHHPQLQHVSPPKCAQS